MFSDDYAYFSSFSTTWVEHAKAYVKAMIDRFELTPEDMVVEVAANDGYLLQFVQEAGIQCCGVEPTHGTAEAARSKGVEIVEEFFGVACATTMIASHRASLMAANNVLAHVPDINDFVRGFALLLAPNGVATFEFPHLLNLITHNQFDTIYHEHYSYLSLTAVTAVFETNGLSVFDVEQIPTHGGSLRVFAQRSDTGARPVGPAIGRLLEEETTAGVTTADFYAQLQTNAERIKNELLRFLEQAKTERKLVAGYGAAAKGNTMLNFAGVDGESIAFVVDRNPEKVGRYLPGSHIPVVEEEILRQQRPDYVVILPWNLESEIREQLAYVAEWGARFVTAVPELTIH